jgi:predicted alpha/beta superfamily hydrolase
VDDLGFFSIPGTRTHDFHARANGQDYRVYVAPPIGSGDGPWPVLFALDADMSFGATLETVRMMTVARELERVLVVGIGYPAHDLRAALSLRNHDFTPSQGTERDQRMVAGPQGLPAAGLGGADGFRRFITDELTPFLVERHAANPADLGVFGFSLGGLFAVHALLQPRPAFQRYIIGSPSLWWGDREMLRLEDERASGPKRLRARVFISAAELEQAPADPAMARFRMVSSAIELAGHLAARRYQGLTVSTHIFPGESHTSAIGPTIARGLRVLYGTKRKT